MTLNEVFILAEDTIPAFFEYANRALKWNYTGYSIGGGLL